MTNDITYGLGVEIKLEKQNDFLKIKETLTRIGIQGKDAEGNNSIFQTAHILHKRGRYYIMHFKEMYGLDKASYEAAKAAGRLESYHPSQLAHMETLHSNLTEDDIRMRDVIVLLLEQWKLLTIVDRSAIKNPNASIKQTILRVITHADKANWKMYPKYIIGKKKRPSLKKAA